MRFARRLGWLLDEALDRLPCYEYGSWHWYGQWGCRLHLHHFWWQETDACFRRPRDGDGWIVSPTLDRIGK